MRQIKVLAAVIVIAAIAASASAASAAAPVITGTVYDDPLAIALPGRFQPIAAVSVKLYRDGGNRIPSADDQLVASTKTDGNGFYSFTARFDASYWVVVDSRTIRRGDGATTWPEQTFGPAGSLCAQPDGTSRTNFANGTCMGGRRAEISDDASTLGGAEHIAGVTIVDDDALGMDFAFSFNVVTSASDAEIPECPVQGSLRQFIVNANGIAGANVMRFVPVARPTEEDPGVMQSQTPRWWLLQTSYPLPEIRDDDTVIDGSSYSFLAPASLLDRNPGQVGVRPMLPPFDEKPAPLQERPELEIVTTGEEGLACSARCVIRSVALYGSRVGIVTRADARVEHIMIGTRADSSTSDHRGEVGLQVESGRTSAEHLFIEVQTTAGIAVVGAGARLDAAFLDIRFCGTPTSGAAVALFSDGSSIRHSVLHQNEGAGVVIGDPQGALSARHNTIEASTMSRNAAAVVLSRGASENSIVENTMMWNRSGGVLAVAAEGTVPSRNRISRNSFNENGSRPIVFMTAENPSVLAVGGGDCAGDPSLPNRGLRPPRITSVRYNRERTGDVFVVGGTACAGHVVEIYRSFVTRALRRTSELRYVRRQKDRENATREETLTIEDSDIRAVDSIGEFNFVGSVVAASDGSFELMVPFLRIAPRRRSAEEQQFEVWADEALGKQDSLDSAFSALSIDERGNTSEISSRHAPLKR